MSNPAARNTPWLRRCTALAAAGGLAMLGSLAPAAALVLPSAARPTHAVTADTASSAVTVTGPQMWNPKGKAPYPTKSSVTVSQTANLVNQFITVSWTGFTPTNNEGGNGYSGQTTVYPVVVAECSGTNPANIDPTTCDGASLTIQGQYGTAGPTTEDYVMTGKAVSTTQGGSATVQLQIQSAEQNSTLGCDTSHPCSLLVLPIDGGNPGTVSSKPNCAAHNGDSNDLWATTDKVLPADYSCAWADRVVIPLHFAPDDSNCKFSNPDFTVVGSPILGRAMTSWVTKLCSDSDPLHFSFEGTVNEPDARTDFLNGADDVALTTEPADGPATGGRSYTYAPLGISATAITYWMDNPKTGQPYTDLELDPRLVTKLITTSYDYNKNGCTEGDAKNPPQTPCNNAVDYNPQTLFTDPEFKQLNPHIGYVNGSTASELVDFPTVLSGNSDMTWELTRWIAANPDAVSFLNGTAAPGGMHVNTNYLGTQFPEEQLNTQDPFGVWSLQYSPQFPLAKVSIYQAGNWSPGVTYYPPQPGEPQGTYLDNPVEYPGTRDLISVLDEPDVAAFDMPAAALLNHAGKYVTPSLASMTAAVDDMTVSSNGITEDDSENASNPDAYPLTMVVYAMVPTSGISHSKAAKIAQWLDFAAGAGQTPGVQSGQLPAGYLPLPAKMRAETVKVANEVRNQTGTKTKNPGGSGTKTPGSSPSKSASPSPSTGASSGPPASKVNASYSSPDSTGFGRMVVPILLVLGALLALAGPSAVVLGRPGGRAAVIAGWRRIQSLSLRGRK